MKQLSASLLLASLLTIGCSQRTQVVVIVEADEEILRDAAFHHAHLYLRASAPGQLDGAAFTERRLTRNFPQRIVLTPEGEGAFSYTERNYEVVVAAHREPVEGAPPETVNTESIVVARARSGYVRGETRVLVVTLEEACREAAALNCSAIQTCVAGACAPLFSQPESLPTLATHNTDANDSDAGPDAFPATDALESDAPTEDGGRDAFAEEPDAYGPDAGMTDGVFSRITRFASPAETFEALGTSVAISDGDEVAVGAPGSTSLGDFVYDASNPSTRPTQLLAQYCGGSGVINAAGTIIAFGCPELDRVVIWTGPTWASTNAPGPALNFLGTAVAMDASGARLVSSSVMTLHTFEGGSAGLTQPVALAGAMSLSDDGNRLVAGFPGLVETYALTDMVYSRDSSPAIVTAGLSPSVALSGDGNTLVVGDTTVDSSRGRVTIFHHETMTGWVPDVVLSGPVMGAKFGARVAVDATGSRIAVGAPEEHAGCTGLCARGTVASSRGSGAVYVFDRGGMREAYIRPPVADGSAGFGLAVALNRAGTRLVIGEPSRTGGGAVYLVE